MRTGIGYDIHRLVKGRKLFLGGEEIEYTKGLEGNSDADVLLHSVCDAMLGAASLGDIGRHFPDTGDEYTGISSMFLLESVAVKIKDEGFEVNNLDITLICEKPNISGYIEKMRENISGALRIPAHDVNIKATTNEKMGPVGKGEAIASLAVVTIIPTSDYERI